MPFPAHSILTDIDAIVNVNTTTCTAEIKACVEYLSTLLQPVVQVGSEIETKFLSSLNSTLTQRYADHWYPNTPSQGSAYRCLVFTASNMDSSVQSALQKAGVDVATVSDCALVQHREFRVWVDPGDVSFQLNDNYPQKVWGDSSISSRTPSSTRKTRPRDVSVSPPANRRHFSPELSPKANVFAPSPPLPRRGNGKNKSGPHKKSQQKNARNNHSHPDNNKVHHHQNSPKHHHNQNTFRKATNSPKRFQQHQQQQQQHQHQHQHQHQQQPGSSPQMVPHEQQGHPQFGPIAVQLPQIAFHTHYPQPLHFSQVQQLNMQSFDAMRTIAV